MTTVTKWSLAAACAACLASGAVQAGAGYTPDGTRRNAADLMRAEPKVKDVYWSAASMFYAGVLDDGTRRDGYASYLCEVLREAKVTGPLTVHVVDIVSIVNGGTWRKLGRADCK